MFATLGIGMVEMFFFRTPAVLIEYAARSGIWGVSRLYNWYKPTLSESQMLQKELEKIRFELIELKCPEWILVEKS